MKKSLWIGCVLLLIAGGALSANPAVRSWFHTRLPSLGIDGPQAREVGTSQPKNSLETAGLNNGLPLVNIDLPGNADLSVREATASSTGYDNQVRLAQAVLPPQNPGAIPQNAQPGLIQQGGPLSGLPAGGIGVPSSASSDRIYIGVASLKFVRDITVSAPADGLIMQLNVDDGSNTKDGETLVVIDSRIAEAEVKVQKEEKAQAELKASDNSNIEFAKKSRELAQREWTTSNELVANGSESRSDNEKKQLEFEKARLQVQVAEIDKKKDQAAVGVSEAKLEAANVQVGMRTINSPFDGFVNEVKKRQFEFVRAGDPILQLTDMTRLRVVGPAQTTVPPNKLLNAKAKITIEISPGVQKVAEGIVGYVSPRTDSLKDSYPIWVEIANEQLPDGQYLLRGGMQASMEIFPNR